MAAFDLGPSRWEVAISSAQIDEDTDVLIFDLREMQLSFWSAANLPNSIRVTEGDGDTQVPVRIIGFDQSAKEGWLRIAASVSPSVDGSVYVYAGDAAATMPAPDSTYGSENAYDANIVAAYEFVDGSLADQSGNGNDLTAVNGPTAVAGPFAGVGAYDFDGINQYLEKTSFTSLSDWPAAVEAWAVTTNISDLQAMGSVTEAASGNTRCTLFAFGGGPGDPVNMSARGDNTGSFAGTSTTSGYTSGAWFYAAGSRDSNAGATRSYIDGGSEGSNSTSVVAPVFDILTVGAGFWNSSVVRPFDGAVGPVIIHASARSADYWSTIHRMWTAPGDVYTVGAEETAPEDATASGGGVLPAVEGSGSAVSGATASGQGALPSVTGSGAAVSGATASGDGVLPRVAGSGIQTVQHNAQGAGVLPAVTGSGTAAVGATGSGGATLPGVAGAGNVKSGARAIAPPVLELPGLSGSGVAVTGATASGGGVLPGITGSGEGADANPKASGGAELPGLAGAGTVLTGTLGPADGTKLVPYLTGAVTDGEPARVVDESTGGFRSGQRFEALEWDMPDPLVGLDILAVAGANGDGAGSLSAPTSGSLTWKPPGGATGAAVAIAQGETKTIAGADTGKWIRVERYADVPLEGAKTLQCIDIYNNLFPDVETDDAIAGLTTPRALFLRNEGGKVGNFVAWVDSESAGGIEVALENPTDGELLGTDLDWSAATTAEDGPTVLAIAAGDGVGLHIRRTVAAAADESPSELWAVHYQWFDGTATYSAGVRGLYRIERTDREAEGIWIGVDEAPDLDADPDETWTSRPHTTSLNLSGPAILQVQFRQRNKWGLWGVATEVAEYPIDGDGEGTNVPPRAPTEVSVTQTSANKASVAAEYDAAADGNNRAVLWVIWINADGTDPDGSGTPAGYEKMEHLAAIDDLIFDDTDGDAHDDGTPLSALVRTRRLDNPGGTTFKPDVIQLDDSGAGTLKVSQAINDWPADGEASITTRFGRLLEVFHYSDISVDGGETTVTVDERALWGTTAKATDPTMTITPVVAVDSENTDTVTYEVLAVAPGRPAGGFLYGNQGAAAQAPVDGPDGVTPQVLDAGENVHLILGEGWSSLYVDTTLVWRVLWQSDGGDANALYIPDAWTLVEAPITGAASGSGLVDAVDANTVYVVVNGQRRMLIDLAAMEITADSITQEAEMPARAHQEGTLGQFAATLFLVWDVSIEDYRPYVELTGAGAFKTALAIDQSLAAAAVEGLWQP